MKRRVSTAFVTAVIVTFLVPTTPVGATPPAVSYSATGCEEAAVLTPTDAFQPGDLLVFIVYECERAVFGDHVVAPFVVSEIGIVRATSAWQLLRWVSNSRPLASRLRDLGLPASFSPRMAFEGLEGKDIGEVSATVPVEGGEYRLRGTAVASPFPAEASSRDGAAFAFDGKKGPAELRYRWDAQEPVPGEADIVVDATHDRALQRWLGGCAQGRAHGVYSLGAWTGTARLLTG